MPRLVPRWILLLIAGLALLGDGVAAGAEGVPPLTALEAGPWARADAVVHIRVETVTDVRAPGGTKGRQVVNAKVLTAFKGPLKAGDPMTIVVYGQRPTLDQARPSVPYFTRGKKSVHVLFVTRGERGHAWRLQSLYDAEGRAGRERVAAVTAVAAWSKIADVETKAAQVVKELLRMLASGGDWSRTHAARELAWLAETRPESFTPRNRDTLRRVAPMGRSADQRHFTRRAVQLLATQKRTVAQTALEKDIWRRTFLASTEPEARKSLLARLASSSDTLFARHAWWAYRRLAPSLRIWFLDLLAVGVRSEESEHVRAAYRTEDDPDVRRRIVRTVGVLGDDDDVPWLVGRLGNVPLRRTSLMALARIGSPLARRHLKVARSEPWADADMQAWIDHLLSPEFRSRTK